MILYTMMPQELIFPNETEPFQKQQMITYQGIPLLVEFSDQQNVQVVRILSSDPQHYLDETICPGSKISFASLEGLSAF
ncbi:YlzJ-like family protein [Paenibacillus sp. BSR1-1]|uniref:YlzJ-like family protein n=1 Tax=Paenibacillus sp. BSR1-1 TaxID=3020845 RepID=UPI0025AF798C|nr:YlzJ-like family protein [Paenibacillus sp. BSR1-1]MDN3014733.1 YlzJ-like family protein [Paenibacillus sp. BSR1-1]